MQTLKQRRPAPPPRAPRPLNLAPVQPAPGQQMAYAVELRILHQGNELGADDVQIALDAKALAALIDDYDRLGIEFYKIGFIYPDGKREEEQRPGKLTKKFKRQILDEAGKAPLTVAMLGTQAGELVCLYVRSNWPRRAS
jgi:hypothetical protein